LTFRSPEKKSSRSVRRVMWEKQRERNNATDGQSDRRTDGR